MTQEQKAKAYDEALERARRIKNREDNWRYSDLTEIIPALEEVLPELAESEDERIRKGLLRHFRNKTKPYWNEIAVKDIIAYLEKQEVNTEGDFGRGYDCGYQAGYAVAVNEMKPKVATATLATVTLDSEKQKENPKSADSIPSDCTSNVKCEDRWHKVTDSLPDNGRLVLAKDCLGNVLLARYDGENWEVNVYDNEDHYCHNSISKWCEIPSGQQKEQKPVESISQRTVQGKGVYKICPRCKERMIRDDSMVYTSMPPQYRYECPKCGESECDTVMYDNPEMEEKKPAEWSDTKELVFKDICNHLEVEGYSGWVLLLNALRNGEFQPKKEWSKEDEKMLQSIIKDFRAGKVSTIGQEQWLKSLRHSWKPSEEQMKALLNIEGDLRAFQYNDKAKIIAELYEQLKRL